MQSFNSGRFDIKLLTHFGFYQYLFNHEAWKSIRSMGDMTGDVNKFIIPEKVVCVNHVRFIDQLLWTPCKLEDFIKGFNPTAEIGKLVFPHSKFNFKEHCVLEFNKVNFPREIFYNDLRNCELDESTYNAVFEIASQKQIKTMRDFLILYNECDVIPFLQACENFRNLIRQISNEHIGTYIEAYNDTIGMPTLASKAMILMSQKDYYNEFCNNWELKCNDKISFNMTDEAFKSWFTNYESQDKAAKYKRETKFTKEWFLNQYKNQDELEK